MQKKKSGPIIVLLSFIIILCFSWLLWIIFGKFVDADNHENRTKSPRPVFTIDTYGSYADSYEAYFNDNLPFRNQLVTLNSAIDFFVLNRSTSGSVIKGNDGWLFFAKTLNDYSKNNLYTNVELERIKNDVLKTANYFEDQGIEFVMFIGPNKSSIYGDYMPKRYETNSGPSRTEQLVEYLEENTDVKIIFPKDELLVARENYPNLVLYQKLDTHWNYMGGYFGTIPLLEALGIETRDFSEITYEQINEPDFNWGGYDLANMLGLSDILNEDYNYILKGYSDNEVTYEGDTRNNLNDFYGAVRTQSNSNDNRKIFFARDSFGEAMTPYLASAFPEIYSVHKSSMTLTRISEEKPDVLIWESVERDLDMALINVENWAQ